MKKLITFLLIVSSLIAMPKDNKYFIGLDFGGIKIRNNSNIIGGKVGYYFYEKNRFKINNRIYLDFKKVDSDATFYITSINLDWIKNTSLVNPYIGINVGYLYFKQNGIDNSSQIWGINAGIIYYINEMIGLEILFKFQKSIDKQDVWDKNFKTLEGSIEFSF